jgi:hypothetical protein
MGDFKFEGWGLSEMESVERNGLCGVFEGCGLRVVEINNEYRRLRA